MKELNPEYYISNAYSTFCDINISCVDFLFDNIISDLSDDIIFLHKLVKYLSKANLITDSEFLQFIDLCILRVYIDENKLQSTIYTLLVDIMKLDKTLTLVECSLYICTEYGFCIDDVATVIRENDSLRYVTEVYFQNHNMLLDSFTHRNIKEINVDNLKW